MAYLYKIQDIIAAHRYSRGILLCIIFIWVFAISCSKPIVVVENIYYRAYRSDCNYSLKPINFKAKRLEIYNIFESCDCHKIGDTIVVKRKVEIWNN